MPDTAWSAAAGYAEASGIPFGEGLMKNRYVGVDSLGYLSLEALTETAAGPGQGPGGLRTACFTGTYPIAIGTDLVGRALPKGSTPPVTRTVARYGRRPLTWPPAPIAAGLRAGQATHARGGLTCSSD